MPTTTTTSSMETPPWKRKAATKRQQCFDRIPSEWRLAEPLPAPKNTAAWLQTSGHLTEKELHITSSLSTRTLLNNIATARLSAVEAITAFCHRAALATQLIKCCTEIFFTEAIAEAKELDEYLAREGKVKGPLHGLPVSVKDGFDVKGFDSTLGWVSMIDRPAERDCSVVEVMKGLGAVVVCKTNIPQSLMMSDSYNHIFKQSTNAYSNELISGGSSGGEGALIACRGSLVGIGTDIGGSIRIPANLQGLYGLSQTTGRVPSEKSGQRWYIVPPVAGPLCPDLATLETFMAALCTVGKPWEHEPFAPPLPWRTDLSARAARPLRIGWFVDDGFCRVQPPNELAVRRAVEPLRKAGHVVVPWRTDVHEEGNRLWLKAVLANGGKAYRAEAEKGGEPTIPGMLTGELEDELDVDEANALHKEIRTFQHSLLRRFHTDQLDAIIQPTQPYVGYKPRTWVQASCHVGYTSIWNLMDWSGLTVPMGVASARAEAELEKLVEEGGGDGDGSGRPSWADHEPRNESERFNKAQYDPSLVEGMPVTVQIVGGRYGEERCVGVAKALEDALGEFGGRLG